MIPSSGSMARAGALALLLMAAGTVSGIASEGATTSATWAQGTVTPPAGQTRVTAPGGLRGRAARRGHRFWHQRKHRR